MCVCVWGCVEQCRYYCNRLDGCSPPERGGGHLPGSPLQGNVRGGALLLLVPIGHEVVLVPVGHRQTVGHAQTAVAVLQHLRIVVSG